MDLIFVTNARFSRNKEGETYGIHTSINKETFVHYLKVFDKVYVVGRVEDNNNIEYTNAVRLDSNNIEILPMPYFIGLKGYLNKRKLIKKQLTEYLRRDNTSFILRVPGSFGRIAASILNKMQKPFGVEVAGDPYDVYAPGTFKHPLRIALRYQGYFSLRSSVKKASAAIYVTEKALQKRYPAKSNTFTTYASNVILTKEAFKSKPKRMSNKKVYHLISIGTLEQMYKGPDVLLKAIQLLQKDYKLSVKLKWVGDGKNKEKMQALARSLSIQDNVEFVGLVKPTFKVRELIDSSDIFILASKTEGLPRALVEAMARGLPCVSTKVGGIPELISNHALVKKGNSKLLAQAINKVLTDENIYNDLAKKNLIKSFEYEYDILNERRNKFYKIIEKMTKENLNI